MRGLYFALFILIVSLCQCKGKDNDSDWRYGEYKNESGKVLTEPMDIVLLKHSLGRLFSTKSGCCGAVERVLFSFLPPAERKDLTFSTLHRTLSQDIGNVDSSILNRVKFLCPPEFDEFVKSGRFAAHIWAAIYAKKDVDMSSVGYYLPKVEQERIYEELSKLGFERLNACNEKCGRIVWKLFGFANHLPENKGAPLFREIVKKAIKYGDALTAKLAKEKLGGQLDDAELREAYGNCVTLYGKWRACAQRTGDEDIDRLNLSDEQRQDLFLEETKNCHLVNLDARYAKVFHKRLSDDDFHKMIQHCTADDDYWYAYYAAKALVKRGKKQ